MHPTPRAEVSVVERIGTTETGDDITRVIRYVCVREAHLRPSSDFSLIVHNGELAFCHDPKPRRDHRWMATGGIALADLRNSAIARELAVR